MAREVVINRTFGFFELSHPAFDLLVSKKNKHALKERALKHGSVRLGSTIPRDDKDLVAVVKRLKEKANGPLAELRIVKIPSTIQWYLDEHEGAEWIVEKHRVWGRAPVKGA